MDGIPRDIILTAEECVIHSPISEKWREIICGVVAMSLWAERQRCIRIANGVEIQEHTNSKAPNMERAVFAIGAMAQRDAISKAILDGNSLET